MINTLFGRIVPAVLLLTAVSPALAGEVGVTNSFSNSTKLGTGTRQLNVISVRTETGNATNTAFKAEVGQLPPASGTGTYFATASATGSSNYNEFGVTTFSDSSVYAFTDTSGSHSVSSFAN
jgi:hypothetical protein